MNVIAVALKKHLTHTCKQTEVAVNLEWRMSAEKVFEDSCLDNLLYDFVAVIALVKTCIAEKSYCKTPTCTLVASVLEGGKSRLSKAFVVGSNLSERIK